MSARTYLRCTLLYFESLWLFSFLSRIFRAVSGAQVCSPPPPPPFLLLLLLSSHAASWAAGKPCNALARAPFSNELCFHNSEIPLLCPKLSENCDDQVSEQATE